jgi:hypothetical protein
MNKLRPYQETLSTEACSILERRGLVYFNIEVRCGKTLIALETCKKFGAKNVLFITKIKAFSSIQWDYDNFGYKFNLTIINKESIHKIESNNFDVVVYDEVHQYGAFPKAGTNQKELRKRFANIPAIMMTGTSTPESYSQIFHQLQLSNKSPFRNYTNFYKWAADYVDVKIKNLGYAKVNDYSDANINKIRGMMRHFVLTFTQEQAGFKSSVDEMIIELEMKPITYQIIKKLQKDLVVISKSGKTIVADTGAKLMQKVHQLSSGTIKLDDGSISIIDDTKAQYIKDNFSEYKIGIFYKYVAEFETLKQVFGDKITTDLNEFNTTDKWIAYQYVSGREGINLSKADYLVMYSIDFSAVTYFQAKDRMTVKDRTENRIFWLFGKRTIEHKIYKTVQQKKNFTLSHYDRAATSN